MSFVGRELKSGGLKSGDRDRDLDLDVDRLSSVCVHRVFHRVWHLAQMKRPAPPDAFHGMAVCRPEVGGSVQMIDAPACTCLLRLERDFGIQARFGAQVNWRLHRPHDPAAGAAFPPSAGPPSSGLLTGCRRRPRAAGVRRPAIVQNASMDLSHVPSRVIPANEYRRERWRNGLGWTREILRLPAQGEDWLLRLSIAEIEQDAAFSAFPGIERELVLLRGAGLRLRFDDGQTQLLEPPHQRFRFAGERALVGELVDGPTHDFNLMWRRDCLRAELLHRPLVGPMLFFADPGVCWAVHLLAGQASFDAGSGLPPLAAGDSAWLAAPARQRFALSGGGELLAIRIEQRRAPSG